jgi:acylglycerol lipase
MCVGKRDDSVQSSSSQGLANHSSNENKDNVDTLIEDVVLGEDAMGPHGGHTGVLVTKRHHLKLKSYFWPSAKGVKARGTLLFVHGHGAHLRFEVLAVTEPGTDPVYAASWVERMNNEGLNVCGIDLQGCGLSESPMGLRFYVESFDDYVDDVIQLALEVHGQPSPSSRVPEAFLGCPIFVGGVSMGGCISFYAAQRRPDVFRGMVLLAPMLSLERVSRKGLNPYLKPLANVASWLVPTAAILATDKNTVYPEIQKLWDGDPLVSHIKTRIRNGHEYMRVTSSALKLIPMVETDFIIFHSECDTMCDPDGSKALFLKSKVGYGYFYSSNRPVGHLFY